MAFAGVQRIVLVGACSIDVILNVPHYPEEDSKLRATSCQRRRGGNTCNSAEVIDQERYRSKVTKDIEIILLNVLPEKGCDDEQFIAESLKPDASTQVWYDAYPNRVEAGPDIDLSCCVQRAGHKQAITSYIISSAAADSRTIVTHNELPEMTYNEFKKVVLVLDADNPKKTLWHFEGRLPEITAECFQYLRIRPAQHFTQALISVEIEKPGREGLQYLADQADIVFFSKSWAIHEGYADGAACLRAQRVRPHRNRTQYMFCTWGEQGSYALLPPRPWITGSSANTARGGDVVHAKEEGRIKVVDPVGAGDAWIGTMLVMLLNPEKEFESTESKLRHANRMAGRKLAARGFRRLMDDEHWPWPLES